MTRISVLFLVVGCSEYQLSPQPVDVDPADILECPFTPISGTKMSVYDCNPVFAGTGEAWGEDFISVGFRTQEVVGHPFYQIWYTAAPTGANAGNYGLGYAVSSNGTDWEANPANPLISANGGWDADNMDAVVVVWDDVDHEYVLAYQGYDISAGDWGMGLYTSADGVGWDAYNSGKPVLDFTKSINGVTYCWPLTFTWAQDSGFVGYLGGQPGTKNVCQMYEFQSGGLSDHYEPDGDPVLEAGPDAYDASGMASAAVVQYDGTWYMFYVGFESWENHMTYQEAVNSQLALATSTDGKTWTKAEDNPFPVALTQPVGQISNVAAQVVGSRILLWVTDYYESIGASAVGFYIYQPDAEVNP